MEGPSIIIIVISCDQTQNTTCRIIKSFGDRILRVWWKNFLFYIPKFNYIIMLGVSFSKLETEMRKNILKQKHVFGITSD